MILIIPFLLLEQELWDRIQSESKCCGVDGPFDYNLTKWLQSKQEQFPGGSYSQLVPKSCCRLDPVTHLTHRSHNPNSSPLFSSSSSSSSSSSFHVEQHYPTHSLHHQRHPRHHHNNHRPHPAHHKQSIHSAHSAIIRRWKRQEEDEKSAVDYDRCAESYSPDTINVYGCYDSISKWFQRTIETLSVIGFCVITFLKLCFAFILRYEIKEMIQKIQMLKGEASMTGCIPAAPLHELEAYLPRASIQQDTTFETQFVSANQCQSPPSSSVTAVPAATTQTCPSTADTQQQQQQQQNRQHRLNSRVEQVRQSSLTSASTITTTAILNSPIKSSPTSPVTTSCNNGNNNEMSTSCSSTTTSSTIKSRHRKTESSSSTAVEPSPV